MKNKIMWVKASERLPGWRTPVKWRLKGVEMKKYDVAYISQAESPAHWMDLEWLDESATPSESPAEQPVAIWLEADAKPEHNVGVLVFIPGEDNHITSGMWDISNEWVLLDEYRTPEEEVTHWMPLPAFPDGYTWNEIPNELVDALKKVAKEELAKRPKAPEQPVREVESEGEFAEWLYKNRWFHFENGRWEFTFEMGSSVSRGEYLKNYIKTTAQLYQLFKEQKEK